MDRRTLLQAIAALPLACVPALAAPPETWLELARRELRLPAGYLSVALPAGVRHIKLAAHGCGLWFHGVEGFGAQGAVEKIPLKLHVPPGRMSPVLEFAAPVSALRLTLDALPFDDGRIEAAIWGMAGGVTPVSGLTATPRRMEILS